MKLTERGNEVLAEGVEPLIRISSDHSRGAVVRRVTPPARWCRLLKTFF